MESNIMGVSNQSILETFENISVRLGGALDVSTARPISHAKFKERVIDSTIPYTIDGKKPSDDVVVLLSNAVFPDAVSNNVAKANLIDNLAGENVGKRIASPLLEGRSGTQTWATYKRLRPISDIRPINVCQKYLATPKILAWCAELARETRKDWQDDTSYNKYFLAPLENLYADTDYPSELREFAEFAHHEVLEKRPYLWTCVEHGDLWIGNVLFERSVTPLKSSFRGDFSVIDWGGSKDDGYPCADVVHLLSIMNRDNSKRSHKLLQDFRKSLNLSEFEVALYTTLSIGQLSLNLDHFPKQDFLALCEKTTRFLLGHKLI
ncbi:MAG: hypothetical protein P8L32_08635 [Paracoccaceae bacterium]|jgi:hypothetical protein|nr:hypothetical protein [Paracoccaceae bacterium]